MASPATVGVVGLFLTTVFVCTLPAACTGERYYIDEYAGAGAGSGGSNSAGGATAKGGTSNGGGAGPDDEAGGSSGAAGTGADDPNGAAGAAGSSGNGPVGVLGDLLYIKASNPDAQDSFGNTVALAGNWLAVGARNESSRATGIGGDQLDDSEDQSGAVYLFSKDESGWAQRAYVKASNAGAVDGFGAALAMTEMTLAVGAPFEDSAATGIDGDQSNGQGGNHGAVYVFVQVDGVWQQQAYVKASNTDWVDLFGTSVALQADTLVVGAPWEDSQATEVDGDQDDDSAQNSGAAYVFTRALGAWSQTTYLKSANTKASDEFGSALAISGSTIVVGAPGESSIGHGVDPEPTSGDAEDSGAVYVFESIGAGYQQTSFLKASNADVDSRFGSSVALDGDTLAVAAVLEGTSNGTGTQSNTLIPESGAVYVFERSAGVWAQTAYLKSTNAAAKYYFGDSLALRGDTLLVGAIGEDRTRLPFSGAVYVFKRTADGWRLRERRAAPNAEANDRFGSAVALASGLLAIGAYNEGSDSPGINGDASNDRTPGAGAVFLYTTE